MLNPPAISGSDSGVELSLFSEDNGSFTLPQSLSLFTAEFGRDGSDLTLQGTDGSLVRLHGYFDAPTPTDLTTQDGATLRAGAVERLAGPLFPGQYAQAGGTNLAEAIGQVETLNGAAFVQRTDGTIVELALGEKVFQGDVVRTENGSTLGLTFADGTIFTLASGSRMVLDELIYDPQATDNSGVFDLIEGSFVFIAGQTAKTGGIEITTPAATMGIRGTTGKIDIQTTNGVSTVTVSLNPDPDGGLGAIDLFDLAGNLITTITGTATKWIISPPFSNEPPLEVTRETTDFNDDNELLSQALAAFQAATTRVQQGETFVELPNTDTDQPDEEEAPETIGEDDNPQGAPIVPPPLDETGDGTAEESDSGTSSPELDGRDEPIIDEEAGPTDDEEDDAALTPQEPNEVTDFADAGPQTEFADLAVQSVEDTALTARLPITNRNGEQVAVSLARGAENGLVVLASDGTFTYTPDADFDGTDSFVVSGLDDAGAPQESTVTVTVDPVNDAPVVTVQTTNAASIETGANTAPDADTGALSGTLAYVDVDESGTSGTWTIQAAQSNATAFGSISIDAETGLWRYDLDQDATDALGDGDTFDETFVATVTDAEGASDISTLVITVTGSNDAPVIAAEVAQTAASMVVGPGAADFAAPGVVATGLVSGQVSYADVDEGAVAAVWTIAAQDDNETALGVIAIDAATGEWSYALDPNTPVSLSDGEETTEVYLATVTDVQGASAQQAVVITVVGTNEVPEIVFSIEDVSATVFEDGFASDAAISASTVVADENGLRAARLRSTSEETFEQTSANTTDAPGASGTLRYTDPDGRPGAALWSVAPQNASLGEMTIDQVTGQWHYFLDQEAADSLRLGDEVVETFVATVTDPFGGVATQVITITVQGSNDAAEIATTPQDLVGSVAEGGVATASGQLSFIDPDAAEGDTATWSVTPDGDSRGTMSIDAQSGQWLYAIDAEGADGLGAATPETETFTATVTDSLGATATQTITITLTGENDAPTMAAGSASILRQQPNVTLDLTALGDDIDAGETGETLSYTITGQPISGQASILDGVLSFATSGGFDDLGAGESRDVTVQITATDAFGAQASADVTITVVGSNTGPVITSDAARATANLVEPSAGTSGGTGARNTLTYTDDDAATPTSGVWSVAPIASLYGDMSIDATTGGWVYAVDPTRSDTLNAGEVVTERFLATITDEDGQTDTQEIIITVTGTNDAPVVSAGNGTVAKSAPSFSIDLTALASDPDAEDSAASLTYTIETEPAEGIASEIDGVLMFQTNNAFDDLTAGETRDVTVGIRVTDAQGVSTTAIITITVTGSDTVPVITSNAVAALGSVTEAGGAITGVSSTTGTLTYTDADAATPTSGTWSITPATSALGVISIDGATGAWTYVLDDAAANDLDAGDLATDMFTATITDVDGLSASQLITITINGTNDAPTFDADSRSIGKDAVSTIFDLTTLVTDPDANDIAATFDFAVLTGPTSGLATVSDGQLTFETGGDFADLGPGDSRTVDIELSVSDAQGASVSQTITVTVTGSNEAPIITSTTAAANGAAVETGVGVLGSGGADASGTLTYSDADESSAAATWSLTGNNALNLGVMSIDANSGAWEFVLRQGLADNLTQGEIVTETYTATVTDAFGATDTQSMIMTITGTNDAPIVALGSDVSGVASSDGAATLTGQLVFADVDTAQANGTWTIAPDTGVTPAFGTMTVSDAGTWTYLVDADAVDALSGGTVQTETYVATITDDFGATDQTTVSIRIDGTNLPPEITSVAGDSQGAVTENGDGAAVPQTATGTLIYVDPDQAATIGTWTAAPVGTPLLGALVIDGVTGEWTYTLDDTASDALDAGDSVTEQFTATITDSGGLTDTQVISITITGTNDAPTLSAGSVATVGQDATTSIDLTALAADVDADDTPATLMYTVDNAPAKGIASIANGILTFDTDGDFAGLGESETEDVSFDVTVADGNGGSVTTTFTVRVSGSNDGPVITSNAAAASGTIIEDGDLESVPDASITGTLTYSDADEGSTTATWQMLTSTSPFGAISINAVTGVWEYTLDQGAANALDAGDSVTETFVARVTDASGLTADQTISVTVQGTNDLPVLAIGGLSTTEDGPILNIDLSTIWSDPDADDTGSTLTYALLPPPGEENPLSGSSLSGTILSYDPGSRFQSQDLGDSTNIGMYVSATDSDGGTTTQYVVASITGVNDAPTMLNATATVGEDAGTTLIDLSVLGDDIDGNEDGNTLTYVLSGGELPKGTAVINGTNLEFNPNGDFEDLAMGETETVTVSIFARDVNDAVSPLRTIEITVQGANDGPTLDAGTLAAAEDGPAATLDLATLGGDPDNGQDGSNLTYSLQTEVAGASVTGNTLSYNASGIAEGLAQGETQDVILTIVAEDAIGTQATNSVVVTVTGANDAPSFAAGTMTATEDGGIATLDLTTLGDDLDSDDNGASLIYGMQLPSTGASVSASTLSFDPGTQFQDLAEGETLDVTLIIQAEDTHGAQRNGTVTVTVTGVNDAPTLASGTLAATEDGGVVSVNLVPLAGDVDSGETGSSLIYTLKDPVAGVSIVDRNLTFDPDTDFQNLADSATTQITATVIVTDSEGAQAENDIVITVTGVNDDPTLTAGAFDVSDGAMAQTFDLTALGADVDAGQDGSTLSYFLEGAPSNASISGTNLIFDPGADFQDLDAGASRDVMFTLRAEDGAGGVVRETVTVTVTGVNNAPVMADGSASVSEDAGAVLRSLTGLGSDPDAGETGADLEYAITTGPAEGTADIIGTNLRFNPGTDFDDLQVGESRDVTVSITAEDGLGEISGAGTFTITVTGENDAPVVTDFTLTYDGTSPSLVIDVLATATDVDDAVLSLTAAGPLSTTPQGAISIDDMGTVNVNDDVLRYTPTSGASGSDGYFYTVTDGQGAETNGFITFNVTNTAPIASDAGASATLISRSGTSFFADNSTYYQFVRGRYTFDEANAQAQAQGGTLAAITSAAENAFAAGVVAALNSDVDAWIGGSDATVEGDWRWVTGSEAGDAFWSGDVGGTLVGGAYANWAAGQPDPGGAGANDHVTISHFDGTWDDVQEIDPRGYLVELPNIVQSGSVSAIDGDSGDTLTYELVNEVAGLTMSESGLWTLDLNVAGYEALGSSETADLVAEYMVIDSTGASDTANLTITLTGANDAPTVVDDSAIVVAAPDIGMPTSVGSVATNDSDPEGTEITYAFNGTYDGLNMASDGGWTFDRAHPSYADLADGESDFIHAYYTATDAGGASSNARLLIEVQGINNAPVVSDETVAVTLATFGTPPGAGWSEWTVATGGNGHSYQYVDTDTTWSVASTNAAALGGHLATVTSAGEQAFVAALAAGRVAFLGGSDSAVEGEWRWVEGPEAGQQFWLGDTGGSVVGGSYTNWHSGQPASVGAPTEDILHLFGDGTWNDLSDIDTPTTTFGYIAEYSGGVLITGSLVANVNDPEGGALSFALDAPIDGLTLETDGSWTFDATDAAYEALAEGASLTVAASYTVTDDTGLTGTGLLNLDLTGVNNAPVIVDGAQTVAEGSGATSIDLSALTSDVDTGDTLTYQVTSGPTKGTAVISGSDVVFDTNSEFTALNDGETEDVTFEVQATDSEGATDTSTITVTVNGVAPPGITANLDLLTSRSEDSGFVISSAFFLGNDDEPNGNPLVLTALPASSLLGAQLILNGTNVSYLPYRSTILNDLDSGEQLTDTFTYTVENDIGTLSATGTAEIVITGIDQTDNDPVPFGLTTVGFGIGETAAYKINDTWLRDDDQGTGIVFKFGETAADGLLPDFLSYSLFDRELQINSGAFDEATDAGYYNLVATGFEADGDYTSIPFGLGVQGLEGQAYFPFVLFGGGTSGFDQVLEIGLDPNEPIDGTADASVDLTGIEALIDPSVTSGIRDVEIIDLANGQGNEWTVIAADLLNLIEGNAPDANEQIAVQVDDFDSILIESNSDWTVDHVTDSQAAFTGVGGDFAGLGLFATLNVDSDVFAPE